MANQHARRGDLQAVGRRDRDERQDLQRAKERCANDGEGLGPAAPWPGRKQQECEHERYTDGAAHGGGAGSTDNNWRG